MAAAVVSRQVAIAQQTSTLVVSADPARNGIIFHNPNLTGRIAIRWGQQTTGESAIYLDSENGGCNTLVLVGAGFESLATGPWYAIGTIGGQNLMIHEVF